VDNPWAKVLPEVLQAAPRAFLLVHPVLLAVRPLVQKRLLYLQVLPQAKLQAASCQVDPQDCLGLQVVRKLRVENGQAAQAVLHFLLATQTLCEPHLHQVQLLVWALVMACLVQHLRDSSRLE